MSDRTEQARTSEKRALGDAEQPARQARGNQPWEDDARAVRRMVAHPAYPNRSTEQNLELLRLQVDSDREHASAMQRAIRGMLEDQRDMYRAQQQQMADFTSVLQRVDKVESEALRDRDFLRHEASQATSQVMRFNNELPARLNGSFQTQIVVFADELERLKATLEATRATEARMS